MATLLESPTLDILLCQITTFIKVRVASFIVSFILSNVLQEECVHPVDKIWW